MKRQTAEMEEMVRNAEKESEKVRLEKMSIMQRWTAAVINIAKRDEALIGFREALKLQELELKGIKAEIDGARSEIISLQVCIFEHQYLLFLKQGLKLIV